MLARAIKAVSLPVCRARAMRSVVSMIVPKGYSLGDRLVAQDSERDVCNPGDVRIKVVAAGVNAPDLVQALGKYPAPKGASPVLGLEVAGVISEYNNEGMPGLLDGVAVGSPVMALTNGGGYAQEVVVPATQCLPLTDVHVDTDKMTASWDSGMLELVGRRVEALKMELKHVGMEVSWPDPTTFVAASVLPETMLTVWANMFVDRPSLPGQVVLIHGGSGNVGTSAISMCKQANAVVIATAHGADKIRHCLDMGADLVIDYHAPSIAAILSMPECRTSLAQLSRARFKAICSPHQNRPGRRPCFEEGKVDQILDVLGAASLQDNIHALGAHGRLSVIAMQQGTKGELDLMRVMLKRLTVTGSTLRSRDPSDKASLVQSLHGSGLISTCTKASKPKVVVGSPYLQEAEQAVSEAFLGVEYAHTRKQPNIHPLPVVNRVVALTEAGGALLGVGRRETTGKTVLIPHD